jgi:hypothetical protein
MMRRKLSLTIKSILAVVLLCVALLSCNKEDAPDCLQQAGEVKQIRREPGAWQSIELRDYLQIELVDSSLQFIEIEGPGNLLSDIRTEIDNGILRIRNENTCNFVRSYKHRITVRIFSPSFPDIQNYGTGDIKSLTSLNAPVIKIENRDAAGAINLTVQADTTIIATHTGVCDVTIRGESQITQLFNQGLGTLDARDLQTVDAFVNNSSINDVYVNTNGYFYAYIAYSGNIYYNGAPNYIDEDIVGNGKLLPLDE